MQHGPDPYARAVADIDELLKKHSKRNEAELLGALSHLARVGVTGQRLADLLADLAPAHPQRKNEINAKLNAWQHALQK
jgi:hypothetical protein